MMYKPVGTKLAIITTALAAVFCAFSATGVSAQTRVVQPKQDTLLNGLKILLWPDKTARVVTLKVRIHSGAAFDPQKKEGVMRLLAENTFPNEAAREYFSDDLGGSLSIETNYDYIEITASSAPEHVLSMLETVSAAVSAMPIDKETTAKLKASLLAELAKRNDDAATRADDLVAARLFGTFPYGRPVYGTKQSVEGIDFADLLDAKARFLTADNATVTIIGNVDPATTFKATRRLFGGWLKADKRVPSTFRQPDPPKPEIEVVKDDAAGGSQVRFAMRGVARGDNDFAASAIYARLLQTRLADRLPAEFGKTVFVRSEAHQLPGSFVIGFDAGKNDVGIGNGKIAASDLLAKAYADRITQPEFSAAKTAFLADRAKLDGLDLWLDIDTYKTPAIDRERSAFEATTLADVQAFADRLAKEPTASVILSSTAK